MIMAAGLGTRMLPLTADRPKPLVNVAGTTLIDHVLDHLRSAGVGKIIVNVHYRAEQMRHHLSQYADDFDLYVSDETALLRDTGGGLVQAMPHIHADPFLSINADNWWTDGAVNALHRLAEQWDAERMDVLMLLVPLGRAHNSRGRGDFDIDADGRLSRRRPDADASHVWTGIQMLSNAALADPPADVFSTNIFWDRAIARGRCFGVEHDGDWFDVGYPEAVHATELALRGG
jgi:MurNAc alpha-1-phosphate uridylyltransferase